MRRCGGISVDNDQPPDGHMVTAYAGPPMSSLAPSLAAAIPLLARGDIDTLEAVVSNNITG